MIDQLIDRSKAFDAHKQDYGPMPARETISFDEMDCSMILPPNFDSYLHGGEVTRLAPTEWAFDRQICTKLGPACWGEGSRTLPGEYLRQLPPHLRAKELNWWLRNLPDYSNGNPREWFVRAYGDECRAVLSDRYSVVDVTETLTWVKEALDSKGGGVPVNFYNPVVTPDILHLRLLFRELDTPGGNFKIGGYFTTGEIGNRRIGAYPLVQRTSCTNSIMVPRNEFSYEHIHTGSRTVIKVAFIASIFEVLRGATETLEKLLLAHEQEIPKFGDYIEGLAKEKGWSISTKDDVLIGSEGYESLFGLVNGVSYAAQKLSGEDERADMELLAGEFLESMLQPVRVR